MENTEEAVERGAFGSPTFFVGDEMFFGKEQLRDVEEMVPGKHFSEGGTVQPRDVVLAKARPITTVACDEDSGSNFPRNLKSG